MRTAFDGGTTGALAIGGCQTPCTAGSVQCAVGIAPYVADAVLERANRFVIGRASAGSSR